MKVKGKTEITCFTTGCRSIWSRAACLAILVSPSGCGVLVGNPEQPDDGTTVKGTVVLGRVADADVIVYELKDDATRGVVVGSGSTVDDGSYSVEIGNAVRIVVVASGGHYIDEATGTTVDNVVDLETLVSDASKATHVGLNVLTTIAATNAASNAEGGLSEAIAAANADVAQLFGVQGLDFVGVAPADLTVGGDKIDADHPATRLGLVMAGFSRLALENELEPADVGRLAKAVAEDFADGGLDGQRNGVAVKTPGGVEPYAAMKGLGNAMRKFAASERNRSGVSADGLPTPPVPPKAPSRHPEN